jgi:cellulose synthase/poly-beta-1,6-N-acetylglucosamine synthase-like glycosyltransferase
MFFILHMLAGLLGLGLVAATLPLALELLVLTMAAAIPWREKRAASGPRMRLAVIVPAHNEQQLIGPCVASLRAAEQVYVIAHNCTDQTAERAAEAGAKVLLLNDEVGGKGVALDFGFRHAIEEGAEAVIVIDADSVAEPNLIRAVSAAFARGVGAMQCRYEVSNPGANRRTRLAALGFRGMNLVRPLGRHRMGLSCGIFGNGFALSAATLARVPYTPNSLVEDLEYHLHLIRAGIRVEFLDEAAVFGEMPETSAAAVSQRTRWEGGRILMRRLWTRPLLARVMRGELRMLEPLADLLALPLTIQAGLLGGLMTLGTLAQLRWLVDYAAVAFGAMFLYVAFSVMLGPEPVKTMGALASVPGYLVWKVLMTPKTRLASRREAAWVRTKRNEPPS